MRAITTTSALAVALSLSGAIATNPSATQSSSSENGDPNQSGLTWWQIFLLAIGGLLVFTCWGCYFFFKHRENQQAKFKPVGSANGDDPRVRSNSNKVTMKPPQGSADESEQAGEQVTSELCVENVQVNTDTRTVLSDEIIIENVNECQPMTSSSAYESELSEIPAQARRGSSSRYTASDDDLEYQ